MPIQTDDQLALQREIDRLQDTVEARDLTIRELYRALRSLDGQVKDWEQASEQMERSTAWRAVERLRGARDRVVPAGAGRDRLVRRALAAARPAPAGEAPIERAQPPLARDLRILIAGPPKAGNTWLKQLFATAYGLRPIRDYFVPRDGRFESFRALVEHEVFPDGSILHFHIPYSEAFADFADGIPARVVTIVRDPYDLFVSAYHHVQRMPARHAADIGRGQIHGKPIGDPAVLAFLADEYGAVLEMGAGWMHSGRSLTVRYEDLLADAERELTRLTGQIRPVPPEVIARAVARNTAEAMRKQSPTLAAHVRVARTGDWRNHLTEAHLAIFRDRHAAVIERLGYPVR